MELAVFTPISIIQGSVSSPPRCSTTNVAESLRTWEPLLQLCAKGRNHRCHAIVQFLSLIHI
eukprot:3207008-Prorocentrum_lima.AAC.1